MFDGMVGMLYPKQMQVIHVEICSSFEIPFCWVGFLVCKMKVCGQILMLYGSEHICFSSMKCKSNGSCLGLHYV